MFCCITTAMRQIGKIAFARYTQLLTQNAQRTITHIARRGRKQFGKAFPKQLQLCAQQFDLPRRQARMVESNN
jgi:hypothetical protein